MDDPTPSGSNRGGTAAPPEPRAGAYSARRAAVALRAMSVRPPSSNSAEHAGPWSRLQTMLLGGPTLRRARRQQEREHDAHSPSFASASSSSRALHSPLPGLDHGPDLWSSRPNVSARSLPHDGSSAAPSPGRDAHARTPAPTPRSEGGAWAAAAASPAWLSRREQQEAAQSEVQEQQQQQQLLPSCWSAFVFQTLQRDPATGQLLLLPLGHSTLVLASLMTTLTGPAIAASASSASAPDSQSDALNPSHPASLSVAGLLQSVGLDPSFAYLAAPRQLPSDRDLLVALQHAASGRPPPAPPPPPRPDPTSYCISDLPSTLPSSTASSRVPSEPSSPRAAAIAPMQPPGRAAEQAQGGAWGSPAKSTSSSVAGSGTGGSGDVPLDDVPLASYRRVTDSLILPQPPNGVPEISGWPFGGGGFGGTGGGGGGGGGRGSGGGGDGGRSDEDGGWWGEEGGSWWSGRCQRLLELLPVCLSLALVLPPAAVQELAAAAARRLRFPATPRLPPPDAARAARIAAARGRYERAVMRLLYGEWQPPTRRRSTTVRNGLTTARTVLPTADEAVQALAELAPSGPRQLVGLLAAVRRRLEAVEAAGARAAAVGVVGRAVDRAVAEEQVARVREEAEEQLRREREEGAEKLLRAREEGEEKLVRARKEAEAEMRALQVQAEAAAAKLRVQLEEAVRKLQLQREEAAAKMEAQREEGAAKLQAQREEAAAKMEAQREEAAAKLQALQEEAAAKLQTQLCTLCSDFEVQLAVEKREAEERLAAARAEASAQLAAAREAGARQLAVEREEAGRQLAAVRQEAAAQVAATREEAAGLLATTREAASWQLAAARGEAERQLAGAMEEAAGQLAAAREEAEAALQREREAMQLESYRASEARRQLNEAAAAASLAAASAASARLLRCNPPGPHSHSHVAAAGGSNGYVEGEEGDEAQGGRAMAAASRAPRKGLTLSSGEQNGNGSGDRSSPQGGDAMARVVLMRGVGAEGGGATAGSDGGGREVAGSVGALHEANLALVAVVSDLTAALDQERDAAARTLRSEREAAARKLAEAEARLRGEAVRKLAESEAELRQEAARKLRDLDAVARDTLRDVAASVSVSLDRLQRTGDRAREVRDQGDDLRDQHEGALLRRAEGAEGALVRAVVAGALDKAALHAQVQELQEQLTAVVSGFEAMVMGVAGAQEQELGAGGAVVALAEQEPQDRPSASDRDEPLPAAGDERALIASLLSQVTAMQAHVLMLQADMAVTDGELARTAAAATADTSALPFIPDSAGGVLPTPSTATGNVAGVSPSPRLSACGGPHYHWPDMQELLQVAAGAAGLMREAAAGSGSGSGSGAAARSSAIAVAAVAAGQGTGMEAAAVGSYGTPARVLFRADSQEDPSGVAAVAAGGAGGEGTDPVLLGSPQQSNSPDLLLQQQRDLPPMLPHPALPPSGNGFAPSQQPVSSSQKARSLLVSSSPVLLRVLLRNRSSVAALQQAGSPYLSPSRPLAEQVAQLQARITAMTRILHRADEQLAAVAAQRQQEVQQDGSEIEVRTSVQHNPLYLSDPTATSQIVAVLPPRHGSTGGMGSTVLHSSPSASHKVISVPPSSAMLPSAPGEKLPVPRHPRYETGLGATAAETDSPLRSSSPFAAAARAAMPRPGLPLGEEEEEKEEVMSASVRTSMEDVGTFSSPWPPSFPTTDPGNLAYDHKATRNRIPTELGTEPEEADAIVAAAAAAAAAGQQQAMARRKAAASTAAVAATASCHKRGQPQQPGRQEASLKQQQQLQLQRSPRGGKGRTSASGAATATSSSLLEQPRWRLSRTRSQLTSASLLRAGSGGAFGAAAAAGSSSPATQPAPPPPLLSARSFSSQHGLPLGSPYGGSGSGAAVGRGRRTSYLVLSPSPSNPAPSSITSSSSLLPMQQQQQRPPWSVAGPSTKYRRAASGQLLGSGLLQGRVSLPGAGGGGVTGGGSSYSVGSSSCASSMVGTPRTTPSGYYSRTSAPATGAAAALLLAQERARQQEREGERQRQSRLTGVRQQGQQGQGLVAAAAAAAEARQRQAAAARGSSSGSTAAKGQGGEQEQERGGGRVQALAAALSARGGAATASAAAAATAPRAPLLKPLVTGRVGPAPAAAAAASDVGVAKEEMHAAAAAAAPPQGAREDGQAATKAEAASASVVPGSVAAAQQQARDGGRDGEEEPGWGSPNSSGRTGEAAMAETAEGQQQREQHVAADKAAEEEKGHGWGGQELGVGTHAQPPHGEQDGEDDEDEEEAELSGEGADRLTPLVVQLQHVPHPLPLGFQHPLPLGHALPAGGNMPPPPPLPPFSAPAKGGAGEARPDADADADSHQRPLVVPAFPPSPSLSQRDLHPSETCHLGPSSASLPVPLPLHLVAPHLLLPHTFNHRTSLGGGGGGGGHDDGIDGDCRVSAPAGGGFSCGLIPRLGSFGRRRSSNGGGPSPATSRQGSFLSMGRRSSRVLPDPSPSPGAATAAAHSQRATDGGVLTLRGPGMAPETAATVAGSYNPHSTGDRSLSASLASSAYSFVVQPDGGMSTAAGSTAGGGTGDRGSGGGSGGGGAAKRSFSERIKRQLGKMVPGLGGAAAGGEGGGDSSGGGGGGRGAAAAMGGAPWAAIAELGQ